MAVHPEALLLSALVRTGEYQALAAHGITSSLFHVHDDEMRWVERYIQKTGHGPSKQALKSQFPNLVVYKADDIEHWCEEVRKEHQRQALIDLMSKALEEVDENEDGESALALLQNGVRQIQAETAGMNPDFDVTGDWKEVFEQVSARVDRVRVRGYAGVPTGFDSLDSITGGLQGGWFFVVAARLGQGKTWTGIRMAWAAAMAKHRVTYFSLEQSRFQIALRVHAFASRQYAKQVFDPVDLNRGSGFDLMAYKQFLLDMQKNRGQHGEFFINDTSRGMVTPSTIASVITNKQPDIVFIDYLTLLGTSGDDWRSTAKLSSELQSVAQRYNIPIVALSQVNRLGHGIEPPGTEHLSQADAIGQDADGVLTMRQKSAHVMKMLLAKNRHGPGGQSWHAKFSPGTGEYEEIDETTAAAQIESDLEVE